MYEPRTFVLEADENGRVLEAFTPDFYLPDQDLYLEITVMKQSLVTRKNRKLRKLRAAVPGGATSSSSTSATSSAGPAIRPARDPSASTEHSTTSGSARSISTRTRSPPGSRARRRDRPRLRAVASPSSSARSRRASSSSPTSRARCRSRTRSTSSSSPATARRRWAATTDPVPQGPRRWRSPAATCSSSRTSSTPGLTLNYLCRTLALRGPARCCRDAPRPALPAARRRPAGPLRRLHRSRRVLRRLRLRPRRAVPQPAGPAGSSELGRARSEFRPRLNSRLHGR